MKRSLNTIRYGIWAFFLIAGVLSCQNETPATDSTTTVAVDESLKSSVKGPHLIEPEQVWEMYEAGESFKVIEISKSGQYAAGHLPGAINFWRPDYEGQGYEYGGMRMSTDELATLLGSNGISPDDQLIIYDTKGSVDAIRFMWMLDIYGHQNMAIMNGGKTAWTKAGYELSTEPTPEVEPVVYTFQEEPDFGRLANMEDVIAALSDPNTVLLDTREPEEYQGVPYIDKGECLPYKKGAFTFGRIPGSVHLNWSDAVDLNDDHRFKSLKDLKYNFEQAGITPDKKIIAYCQSGVRSSHTTYVLTELLGYPDVKNYDGSWIEWSYNYIQQGNVDIERDLDEEEHKKRLALLETQLKSQSATE